MKEIKVIGFDADDTLWVNEPYFRDIESEFCNLMKEYLLEEDTSKQLFKTEIQNLSIYGYGVKGFILSLIETAINISNNKVPIDTIIKIITLGKRLLNKNIELLDGVKETLEHLINNQYRLIVATKGDLLDQERKLRKSGLEKYFHHIEIMSDKKESDYEKLINHLDITPDKFVMIGNSLKSDILPVINIGGKAIHIPFHTTWDHEHVDESKLKNKKFNTAESISEVLKFFTNEKNH